MTAIPTTDTTTARLLADYRRVRQHSEDLCAPLNPEDYIPQPCEDVSPAKWHLAHITWFWETFLLTPHLEGYEVYDDQYSYLFNSYYEGVGTRIMRTSRGNLTRPTVEEVYRYRAYVDEHMSQLIESGVIQERELVPVLELGLAHEQQHQELFLTDQKYIFGHHPFFPVYKEALLKPLSHPTSDSWVAIEEGIYEIGYQGDGFHFDNERGVHKCYLHQARVQDRVITNGEYLQFMEDGGYEDHNLWLSEGWEWVKQLDTKAPMYWHFHEGEWWHFTMGGLQRVDRDAPVAHVCYYEADAYASWRGKRLATEQEWEVACDRLDHGQVWEWTSSAYLPYPFFEKAPGAIGEYNGKFMSGQMVLRGGSVASPEGHVRPTYRNFFHADKRWQFMGIRLAEHV